MNVEEFIEAIEEAYLQEALDKLAKTPKDLVTIYLSALEYKQAKLMRGNTIVETGDTDKEIIITTVEPTSNTNIQPDSQGD